MDFRLKSSFKPTGDQPQAIKKLVKGIYSGLSDQVLLGVTGSGKTFTIANLINQINRPALVISHNKTLAAQLYQEFKSFFPKNGISYFVSYYDYYQPEAYIPQTDTYIEKEVNINDEIDRLRLEATTNLLTRNDTLVVASVSCIYNLGSPQEYSHYALELFQGSKIQRKKILEKLIDLQYERNEFEFKRGTFRVKGDTIDIYPAYEDKAIRIEMDKKIEKIFWIDPFTGSNLFKKPLSKRVIIYPAKHFMTDHKTQDAVFKQIKKDLAKEIDELKIKKRILEVERLKRRVNYDLEMITETGYVNGIENYSRYFDNRKVGDPPYTLLDYCKRSYGDNWLLIIDESHQTIPQLKGMYQGDYSRKKTLVDHGFRLKAAFDNRPLKFSEFLSRMPQTIYVSATPFNWEIERSKIEARKVKVFFSGVVEQLIRPTGLVDPEIEIKSTKNQIEDLIKQIKKRVEKKERVLVTTLTKRTAEALASYFSEQKDFLPKVTYLHSEINTLERSDILDDLRRGNYDVLVGINLLREGLDLPEVSLVAILDADKEGFLRSETSLIQVMGRAARHIKGKIIMYADEITFSMKKAIEEVDRRRKIQLEYNKKHGIIPESIKKPFRRRLVDKKDNAMKKWQLSKLDIGYQLNRLDPDSLTPLDRKKLIITLKKEMKKQASELNFELAAILRDKIKEIET